MTEALAEVLALAAIIPCGVILLLFFVFYGQLIVQLRDAHTSLWRELGQPTLMGRRDSLLRLMVWVSKRGYLTAQNVRTSTLGERCRLIYLGMIAVVPWTAGILFFVYVYVASRR